MPNPNLLALESLKRLGQGVNTAVPGSANPYDEDPNISRIYGGIDPIALEGLRSQRLGEMKRNIDLSKQPGSRMTTGATPYDVADLEGEIAGSPYTGAAEEARVTDTANRYRAAQLQGFDSPQAAAEAGRQMEMQKLAGPERVAKIGAEADIEKQRIAAQAQRDVAESKAAQQQTFFDMLMGAGRGGMDISHVTAPGGGGFTFNKPTTPSAQTTGRLVAARKAMEQSGPTTGWGQVKQFFGGTPTPTPEKTAYDALLGQTIAGVDAPEEHKQVVLKWLSDPATMNKPLEDLIDVQNSDPTQVNILRKILMYVRGQ